MATKKTTTKAKTKTTKKPAVKAKASAAKATTKSTKSKKVEKPAVKASVTKTDKAAAVKPKAKKAKAELTAKSLRKLNFLTAFLLAALAAAAGFLMTNASYALSVGYMAKDELISVTEGRTEFVHATQSVMDLEVRWMVIGILGIAALFALLAATRYRTKYEKSLETGVSSWRWVTTGITGALLVEAIALFSGVSDILTLKLIGGVILVVAALGWVNEKRNKQAGRPVWSEYFISVFAGILPWILIVGYAVSTWIYGLIRYPWYVYAVMAAAVIGFVLLAVNEYKRNSGWKNNLVVERNYLVINLALYAAFGAILILGFQK